MHRTFQITQFFMQSLVLSAVFVGEVCDSVVHVRGDALQLAHRVRLEPAKIHDQHRQPRYRDYQTQKITRYRNTIRLSQNGQLSETFDRNVCVLPFRRKLQTVEHVELAVTSVTQVLEKVSEAGVVGFALQDGFVSVADERFIVKGE